MGANYMKDDVGRKPGGGFPVWQRAQESRGPRSGGWGQPRSGPYLSARGGRNEECWRAASRCLRGDVGAEEGGEGPVTVTLG